MSFDWQTEEDDIDWEGQVEPAADTAVSFPRRRRWLLLGVFLVAGTAVLLAFGQVSRQVESAASSVAADVEASHRLLQEAAIRQDGELFATYLSGRDPQWGSAQTSLVNQGLYLDRPEFGLTWLPGGTAVISTSLAPDLKSAELVSIHAYSYPIGHGLTETVRLQQVALYRRAEDRFLLSPPLAEFWGERRQFSGTFLTINYLQRDEAWIRPLAARLEAAAAETCAQWGADCPDNFHLTVGFTESPAVFLPDRMRIEGLLALPTPTLLGVPVDESGWQVLRRGYETAVVKAVLAETAGSGAGLLHEAAVSWILAEKGLRPWPLLPENWQALAEQNVELLDGTALWQGQNRQSEEAVWLAHAIVQFLVEEQGVSSRRLLASIVRDRGLPYTIWLSAVMNEVPAGDAPAWRDFISQQAANE